MDEELNRICCGLSDTAIAANAKSLRTGWRRLPEWDAERYLLQDWYKERGLETEAAVCCLPWECKEFAGKPMYWRVRVKHIQWPAFRCFRKVVHLEESRSNPNSIHNSLIILNAAPLLFPAMTLRIVGLSHDDPGISYRFTWVQKRGRRGSSVRRDTDFHPRGFMALFETPKVPVEKSQETPIFDLCEKRT